MQSVHPTFSASVAVEGTSNWLCKYLTSDAVWGNWLPRDPAIAADIEIDIIDTRG